jgi:hypothetical protein
MHYASATAYRSTEFPGVSAQRHGAEFASTFLNFWRHQSSFFFAGKRPLTSEFLIALMSKFPQDFTRHVGYLGRVQKTDGDCRWPCGLWRRSADAWLLGRGLESRWEHGCSSLEFVAFCVGSGLCEDLITHAGKSYRLRIEDCASSRKLNNEKA